VFSVEELVAAFDVHDVNPNPARFDLKKAEAINAAHVRLLDVADFERRIVPYLHAAGLVGADDLDALTPRERAVLDAAAPLVQPRLVLLGEAAGMLGFLLTADDDLVVEDTAREALRDDAKQVLEVAMDRLAPLEGFDAATTEAVLREAIVDGLGIKPKFAFAPLRVAVTGRRVSPPLFESFEILGKDATLARLGRLRDSL